MREDFDALAEASGKKDAEFARDIYKEFLAAKREELTALRDAASTSPQPVAKKVSYKNKSSRKSPAPTVKGRDMEASIKKLREAAARRQAGEGGSKAANG